jgi:hypothetical protein
MRQLPAQKTVNYLVSRWQTLDQPTHKIKIVVDILPFCHFFQLVLTLKRTNRHHLIFTVVIGLFCANKALSKLAFTALLVVNAHESLAVLVEFGFGPLV